MLDCVLVKYEKHVVRFMRYPTVVYVVVICLGVRPMYVWSSAEDQTSTPHTIRNTQQHLRFEFDLYGQFFYPFRAFRF